MIDFVSSLKSAEPKAALDAAKRVLGAHFQGSLFDTCKYLLGYSDLNERTHRGMVDALESQTKRKLLVMPRGTFKSSVGVVGYSVWSLLRNPNERILIDSEVYTNSKNFLREIRAHLENPVVTSLFGKFKTDSNWNEGELTIAQRKKSFKEASITCGGLETVKVGQHYTVIIGDDMNSGNNSATQEGRRKVIQHYQLNTAILEPEGTYIIIGTRYAADDVIGYVLENEAGPGLMGRE